MFHVYATNVERALEKGSHVSKKRKTKTLEKTNKETQKTLEKSKKETKRKP